MFGHLCAYYAVAINMEHLLNTFVMFIARLVVRIFFSYFKLNSSNSLIYCSIEIEFPVKIFLTHTLNDFLVSE